MSRLILPLLFVVACGSDDSAPADSAVESLPTLEPPGSGEGFQISMFGTAPAYSEVWLCEIYSLPTDEYTAVNKVDYLQNAGTHHMTLSTTSTGTIGWEPGTYPCEDLYADADLMADQVMFFGSQGTAEDTMTLPEGVVADFPPAIDVIHEVHYVNTSAEDVELFSYLNAWTIDRDDIVDRIWGGQVRDENIEIPAGETATEWTRCVMNEDVEILFLASHTHQLGIEFTIAPFDGTETGEIFYTNDDWHDPKIVQYDPPLVVPAGTGFEYACTWANTTDQTVTYGTTAEDEMCNLAIVHTPFSTSASCDVVETSDGVLWEG